MIPLREAYIYDTFRHGVYVSRIPVEHWMNSVILCDHGDCWTWWKDQRPGMRLEMLYVFASKIMGRLDGYDPRYIDDRLSEVIPEWPGSKQSKNLRKQKRQGFWPTEHITELPHGE